MSEWAKDRLYQDLSGAPPFAFNEAVARVFDDMLPRSIPQYAAVQGQILKVLRLKKGLGTVFDLGCSTGNALFYLAENLNDDGIHYTGVDNSSSMIARALEKKQLKRLSGRFSFHCADILDFDCGGADAVLLNYVLQFLPPDQRLGFLRNLCATLSPGATVIVSEKTCGATDTIAKIFDVVYTEFKLEQHYSHLEIARKRKALEKILLPFDFKENFELLQKAGFAHVAPISCWFNFVTFLAIT